MTYRAFRYIYSSLRSSATPSTLHRFSHPLICNYPLRNRPRSSARVFREYSPAISTCTLLFFDSLTLYIIRYLLGSGGTLMFDVTIVTQAFLYRPKGGSRGRRPSRTHNEEEAGLLSAEATGAEDSPITSRRRAGSVTRGVNTEL